MTDPGIPSLTIEAFIAELGAKTPSPGGGAVAALAGASGAALLLMAAEYSDWAGAESDPRKALRDAAADILRLAQEDSAAYAAYSEARSRRKEDPEAYARALESIAEPPIRFAERAADALETAAILSGRAPKWFACDIAIAVSSLETCAQGGLLLCGINAAGLQGAPAERLKERIRSVTVRLEALSRRNSPLLMRALPGK